MLLIHDSLINNFRCQKTKDKKRDLHALDEMEWCCVIPAIRKLLFGLRLKGSPQTIGKQQRAANAYHYL
jgi:hypothetical protein